MFISSVPKYYLAYPLCRDFIQFSHRAQREPLRNHSRVDRHRAFVAGLPQGYKQWHTQIGQLLLST